MLHILYHVFFVVMYVNHVLDYYFFTRVLYLLCDLESYNFFVTSKSFCFADFWFAFLLYSKFVLIVLIVTFFKKNVVLLNFSNYIGGAKKHRFLKILLNTIFLIFLNFLFFYPTIPNLQKVEVPFQNSN